MSWESTAVYYRLANEMVRDRLGGLHSARCLLASVDFDEVERLQATRAWDDAGALLAEVARGLEAGGADLLVLCTNTMHKVAAQVQVSVTIPFIHIADTVADAVLAAGLRSIGLLATAYTMEQDFYRERLTGHGLKVTVPAAPDRAEVHRIIYEELCLGSLRDQSRQFCRGVMSRLAGDGAEGIVLGCTELELLISSADTPLPVFPSTRLHVAAAVEASIGDVGR